MLPTEFNCIVSCLQFLFRSIARQRVLAPGASLVPDAPPLSRTPSRKITPTPIPQALPSQGTACPPPVSSFHVGASFAGPPARDLSPFAPPVAVRPYTSPGLGNRGNTRDCCTSSDGADLGGGEVGTLTARLQALQHAHFWRQHRSLFTAVNALLEPVLQAVSTDAVRCSLHSNEPGVRLELTAVAIGQQLAQTRLHQALQVCYVRADTSRKRQPQACSTPGDAATQHTATNDIACAVRVGADRTGHSALTHLPQHLPWVQYLAEKKCGRRFPLLS